ncbi:MAG TPA: glycosyltransferase family 2 protein [Dyella sp.]|uniref:glycosyltransferase family 2 protein n=1 Tax=Dyella sp. TaxID=1869338 RepID=UPI002CDCEF7F|nr:glycosyltransferase family 2 protein [Dyella sp.]HTV87218.1 glycosyltransferase family 2 protein [Dyella sp.]
MSALDTATPALTVIVVAADSGPSLRDCVNSVLACSMPLQLLLIDNKSTDGMPQAIARAREKDPRLTVIYNHANLGFGPAINLAAAQARGEALLILNPDCLLQESALQRLLAVLASERKVGVIGAVVCDAKGVPDPASYRRDPVMARALSTLFKRDGDGEGVNIEGDMPDHVVEAEAISGAVMLMPRRVFDWLGGFDEKYFLHCEDLDICRRARDGGWRVLLAGDVRVLHGKGGSSRHRPVFVSYHKHRGMWRWFGKFDPAAQKPHVAATVWLGLWVHFLLQIPGQLARMAKR